MFTARIFSENDHVIILFHAVGLEESKQEHSRDVCRVTETSVLRDGCALLQAETWRCIPLTASSRVSVQTSLNTLEETKPSFAQLSPYRPRRNWQSNYFRELVFCASSLFDVTSLSIVFAVESIIL
jgi:hypothetical protein